MAYEKDKLRRLIKDYGNSGVEEDYAAILLEKMRLGDLGENSVKLAARLNCWGARHLFPYDPEGRPIRLSYLYEVLNEFEPRNTVTEMIYNLLKMSRNCIVKFPGTRNQGALNIFESSLLLCGSTEKSLKSGDGRVVDEIINDIDEFLFFEDEYTYDPDVLSQQLLEAVTSYAIGIYRKFKPGYITNAYYRSVREMARMLNTKPESLMCAYLLGEAFKCEIPEEEVE